MLCQDLLKFQLALRTPPSNTAIFALAGVLVFGLVAVKCVWEYVKIITPTPASTAATAASTLTLGSEKLALPTIVVSYVPAVIPSVAAIVPGAGAFSNLEALAAHTQACFSQIMADVM